MGEENAEGTSNDRIELETTKTLKIQRERIQELEDEKAERELADSKEQLGGRAEAGGSVEEKEENPHEYRVRIEKELSQGKTEFGS